VLARFFGALNEVPIRFEPENAVGMALRLAGGEMDEAKLAEWFRARRG